MTDEAWERIQRINDSLPDYYRAKLEADELFAAMSKKRLDEGDSKFQPILLRPGLLADSPATGKVELGKAVKTEEKVSREDVAIVADRLLARDDTRGWIDILGGEEPIDEAVERVVREGVDTIEGEDVASIYAKYF
jgi:hypothetical protein